MSTVTISLDDLHALAVRVLTANNTRPDNADHVARALVAAEADGLRGHGASRLKSYAAQASSGKVDGHATPALEQTASAALRVDAAHGFAYPAIAMAIERLGAVARQNGIAAAAITNSHHCGSLGYHVEQLADAGLVALMVTNTPKAIAPWGGTAAVFGTNPIAFAAPQRDAPPLVIDTSLSKVARGEILVAAEKGEPIPEGWALDAEGNPITDAKAALQGTMVPMGEAKGAALVLMVEILAAALTGSHFGFEASSFFTGDGPAPDVGQFILAMDPGAFSAGSFAERLETLAAAITGQPGTRLPGEKRLARRTEARKNGIVLDRALHQALEALAEDSPLPT